MRRTCTKNPSSSSTRIACQQHLHIVEADIIFDLFFLNGDKSEKKFYFLLQKPNKATHTIKTIPIKNF